MVMRLNTYLDLPKVKNSVESNLAVSTTSHVSSNYCSKQEDLEVNTQLTQQDASRVSAAGNLNKNSVQQPPSFHGH